MNQPIFIQLEINEPIDLFRQFRKEIQDKNSLDENEFKINPEFGEGFGAMLKVEFDLFLNYFETKFNRELLAIRKEKEDATFHQIIFWTSEGDAILSLPESTVDIGKKTTSGIIFGSAKLQGVINVKPNYKTTNLSITFSEEWLQNNRELKVLKYILDNPHYFICEYIDVETDILLNQYKNAYVEDDFLLIKSITYKLLTLFFSKLLKSTENIKVDINNEDLMKIFKAVEIIENSIDSLNKIKDLCKMVGLSETSFTLKFKKVFRITVYKFIQQKKIERAIEYLKFTDLSIADVAEKVGYASLSSFTKVFEKQTGSLPGTYKKTS